MPRAGDCGSAMFPDENLRSTNVRLYPCRGIGPNGTFAMLDLRGATRMRSRCEERMPRLVAELERQFSEATEMETAIKAGLPEVGDAN
jgi:hypothetical protein